MMYNSLNFQVKFFKELMITSYSSSSLHKITEENFEIEQNMFIVIRPISIYTFMLSFNFIKFVQCCSGPGSDNNLTKWTNNPLPIKYLQSYTHEKVSFV